MRRIQKFSKEKFLNRTKKKKNREPSEPARAGAGSIDVFDDADPKNGTARRIRRDRGSRSLNPDAPFSSHERMTVDVDSLYGVRPRKAPNAQIATPPQSVATVASVTILRVVAPAGRLGVVFDASPDSSGGGHVQAKEIREDSPLLGRLRVGDRIVAVDDVDARGMSAPELGGLLASKSEQKERRIMVSRVVDVVDKSAKPSDGGGDDDADAVGDRNDEGKRSVPDALSKLPRRISSAPSILRVVAPAGKLGIVLDTPSSGGTHVREIMSDSPLLGKIRPNDKIIAVDNEDVRNMAFAEVSKLLASKGGQRERKIMIVREFVPENPPAASTSPAVSDRPPTAETQSDVDAPPGKLGLVLDNPESSGPTRVSQVVEGSPLEGKVRVGDRVVAVDGDDMRGMKAARVSRILAARSQNPSRMITVLREADKSPDVGSAAAASTESRVSVDAPSGKLGVVFDSDPEGGPAFVSEVKEGSSIASQIRVGDKIVALDGDDVRGMNAVGVSSILGARSRNPSRMITVLREAGESPNVGAAAATSSEMRVSIDVPSGKLGVVFDWEPEGGPAFVSEVKEGSSIGNQIRVGDRIVAVDGDDVRGLTALDLSRILGAKRQNPSRMITVLREAGKSPKVNSDGDTVDLTGVAELAMITSVGRIASDVHKPSGDESDGNSINSDRDTMDLTGVADLQTFVAGSGGGGRVDDDDTSTSSSDAGSSSSSDEIIDIIAPAGMLGIIMDSDPEHGPVYVTCIKKSSPLTGKIQMLDGILAIDDQDVSEMNAIDVSMILSSKSTNERKISVWRRAGRLTIDSEFN